MAATITDEQVETIKAVYAETGKIDLARKAAGVSWETARKYAGSRDEYESIREQKRIPIIEKIVAVQVALLDAIIEPAALLKASLQEKATAFGIVTDKYQLMIGEATERHEHRDANESRESFARRVDELAERRRSRGTDLDPHRTASA